MITPKWWLGLLLAWTLITILCLTVQGSFMGADQTNVLSQLAHLNISWGSIGTIWSVATSAFTWNYSFFQSGIGVYVKLILTCLSLAVFVPLAIDLGRVVLKPFGG